MVLIKVRTSRGTTRSCTAKCHNAKGSRADSQCVCGGRFRGIGDDAASRIPVEEVMRVREQIALRDGETVQLRIGA